MSTTKPISFALLPDELLKRNLIYTSPTQTGPYVGPAAPALDNAGNLVPFSRGRWDEDSTSVQPVPTEINLKLVNAGGLYGHAEWSWKFESDGADQYRGLNDVRYQTDPHDPFSEYEETADNGHLCLIYSKAFGKVLAFKHVGSAGTGSLLQATRNASVTDPDTAYTVKKWPTANGFSGTIYKERNPSTACKNTVGWENPDGTLRIMYPYSKPEVQAMHAGSVSYLTMDVWGSSDGGETWEMIVEDVANKYLGGDRVMKAMTADVAGDWIRCSIMVSDVGSPVVEGNITMVSADKGATWKVCGLGAPDGRDYLTGIGTYNNAVVVGCGTADGRFIRARIATASYTSLPCIILFESATRDSDWSAISRADLALFVGTAYSSTVGGFSPRGIFGAKTDSHAVFLVPTGADVTGGFFSGENLSGFDGAWSMLIPLNDIDNATNIVPGTSSSGWGFEGSWVNLGHRTAWSGGSYTNARNWSGFQNMGMVAQERRDGVNSMRWVGDRIMLMTYSRGRSGDSVTHNTVCATYCAKWHRRPLRAIKSTPVDSLNVNGSWLEDPDLGWNNVYSNYWSPVWGKAGAVSAAYSSDTECPDDPYWSTSTGGSSGLSDSWNPNEWTLDSGTASNQYFYLKRNVARTIPFGNIGMISWRMKVYEQGDPDLPSSAAEMSKPHIGARVRAVWDSTAAGGTYHISVAATTSEVAVYDATAGTTLYHKTGEDFTKWTEFRLAFGQARYARQEGQDTFADFGFGRVGEGNKWWHSGLLTLDTNTLVLGPGENQFIEWGIGVGGVLGSGGAESKVGYSEMISCLGTTNMAEGQLAFINPTTLRGAVCSAGERHIGQGIFAAWGGGGGFKDDDFTVPIKWQYGTDQLNSPSPATHWRSTSNLTQEITFDSRKAYIGETGQDYRFFHHRGMSLVGCNAPEIRVDWSQDAAFTMGVVGTTVDFGRYTATADTWKNDGVLVGTTDRSKWEPHELIGMYVQVGAGQSFKIQDNTRDYIYFSGLTQALTLYGYGSNTGLKIYGTQSTGMIGAHNTVDGGCRWMRITVPEHSTSEGYHRIGSFVAGNTVQFSVPMDWTNKDEEQGNVKLTTGMNGSRVGYVAGPARRTFKGTVLGDASRFRDEFRASVRELTEYSGKPLVLVLDDEDLAGTMLYSRFTSSTTLDNVAWKYDTGNSRWIKVGNMAVTFEEEV
jgi:hypothetical protein